MKTYYCVVTTFDDRGRVTAAITAEKTAPKCPESGFTSTARKDVYSDWYDSYEAAEQAVENAKRA